MHLQVLPLAITMVAGPQIMSAIVFVTTSRAVRVSIAFLMGVVLATAVGVLIARLLAALLGSALPVDGESPEASTLGKAIQIVLIALLVLVAVRNYLRRKTTEPPKWLGTLLSATPTTAFKTGLLVILAMPSDIVVMLTVGMNLQHHRAGYGDAVLFIAATTLLVALPLLLYLIFHKRAIIAMPRVRDWMNVHSWLVNIIVCLIFILLVATGG
ncbi:GAP family protein [Saccharopolyspora sp. ASAGF58]|uniref:GAP family protein n=1 Tax=Saccharopolyspora sp. ASAGF58 TaxID=2719023 RepID=UPI0014401E17|nr:GAP family protein [Saccharopolyspora sp. ASAGF58]QIZ38451.1 GAP family protein [Saccharopolyspora sp. ASAGF58]